jgi:RPA family protein
MSANEETDSETTDSTSDATADAGPGTREVAYRLFATEFEDSELSYSESDEERAPNYVVTPTGLRLNRLFAVGVLTEVERINTDTLRGRIVDPTGAFVTYAGQYQPEAQAFLDGADSPSFVAITGKARTFEPEDSDRIFTSVRPESLSEVDADTRDRWTVSAAEATLERIAVVAAALESDLRGEELRAALETAGVDAPLAAGIPRALDYYGTTTAYLEAIRQCAVDALEVVAGEREEVPSVDVEPDEGGTATLGPLPDVDIELSGAASEAVAAPEETGTATAGASTADADSASESAEPSDATATQTTESPDSTATTDAETDTAEADAPESTASATESSEPVSEPTTSTATETAAESTTTAASDDSPTPDTATESTTAETDVSTEPDTTASSTVDTDTATPESSESAATDDVDDAADDPEMYQLDDEEREEIESEFGADFSSGNEVDPAGEADIDVPDADELAAEVEADSEPSDGGGVDSTSDAAEPATSESTETTDSDDSTESLGSFEDTIDDTDESATESESESDETTSESTASTDAASDADAVDLEDAAVELMADLDDGDGADRKAVVDAVVDAHGFERAAVEDAIDDALMGGRCYEPDDGTLKPI